MLKSELLRRIVQRQSELRRPDVELSVNFILDHLATALAAGRRIEIRGFGAFSRSKRPPRTIRNPRTGAMLRVNESIVIRFKPGSELRERLMEWKRVSLLNGMKPIRRRFADAAEGTTAVQCVSAEKAGSV